MANQDIPVSGLQNTNSISTEDLALVTVVDELSATGYTSKHITEGNRARQYLGSFTWQDLETEAKDIFGAINEAATTGGNNVYYIHWTSPSTITESGADIAAAYADGSDLVILYTDSQTGQVYTLPLVKVDDNAGALNLSFGATIYQKTQMVAYLQLLKPSYTIQGKDCTTISVPVIKDTTTTSTTETWSAKKINDTIAAKTEINDTTTTTTTTWSSDKIADELADKAEIADTVVSTASAWSSSRIVGLLPTDTAQGTIATFTDGADDVPIVSGIFDIVAQQEGSGDPSPSNPRPITGYTGMTIHRADGEDPHVIDTEYEVDWTTEAGTVYGGNYNSKTGVLTVDIAGVDLGSLTWGKGTYTFYATLPNVLINRSSLQACSCYKIGTYATTGANLENLSISLQPSGQIFVKDTDKMSGTEDDFKQAVSGQTITYKLATPQTVQLDPVEIKTLLGSNEINCDTGDSSVTYHADVQKYIDKKIAAALSNRGLNLSKSAEPEEKEPEEVKEEVKEEQEGANNER